MKLFLLQACKFYDFCFISDFGHFNASENYFVNVICIAHSACFSDKLRFPGNLFVLFLIICSLNLSLLNTRFHFKALHMREIKKLRKFHEKTTQSFMDLRAKK